MVASSSLFVVATGAADALVKRCGWASSLEIWGVALLVAPLAGIVCDAYRGAGVAWDKGYREDIVPFLCVTFPVYAFVAVHMVGWACVCDTSTPYVAVLASVAAVLSGVMFGVYWDVSDLSGKWLLRKPIGLILAMAIAALAYNVLQVANGRDLLDIGAVRQFLVTMTMVATATAVAIFGAEYSKNRRQIRKRYWSLPVALVVVGALAPILHHVGMIGGLGDGDDVYIHIVQSIWVGVTVAGAMLGARAAAGFPQRYLWLWLAVTVAFAALAVPYHGISNNWVCLVNMDRCADPPGWVTVMHELEEHPSFEHVVWRMQIYVAIALSALILFVTMSTAMLGAVVAARMRLERNGSPPHPGRATPQLPHPVRRRITDDARNSTAGPPPAWPIWLCDVARRDETWGMLRPYVMWPPPHMP